MIGERRSLAATLLIHHVKGSQVCCLVIGRHHLRLLCPSWATALFLDKLLKTIIRGTAPGDQHGYAGQLRFCGVVLWPPRRPFGGHNGAEGSHGHDATKRRDQDLSWLVSTSVRRAADSSWLTPHADRHDAARPRRVWRGSSCCCSPTRGMQGPCLRAPAGRCLDAAARH